MNYELFEQGPEVYIPVLLLNLVITVLAYGAFPLIFAKARNIPITKKKYKRLCYGINFAVMFVFMIIRSGGGLSFAPYILWTSIFLNSGAKTLCARGIMLDGNNVCFNEEPATTETDKIRFCRKCGAKLIDGSMFCRKCGTEIIEETYETNIETGNIDFCKNCGADITNDTDTCHVCGEQKGTN